MTTINSINNNLSLYKSSLGNDVSRGAVGNDRWFAFDSMDVNAGEVITPEVLSGQSITLDQLSAQVISHIGILSSI